MATGDSPTVEMLLQRILNSTQEDQEKQQRALSPVLLPNGKKTRGRVKVPMNYVKNKNRRLTTFSKRKSGLFKKVAELECLTGAQCMLVVASETCQIFTYASPKLVGYLKNEGQQAIKESLQTPDPVTGELPPLTKYTFAPMNSPNQKTKWNIPDQTKETEPAESSVTSAELVALNAILNKDEEIVTIDSDSDGVETDSEPACSTPIFNDKTDTNMTRAPTLNMFQEAAALFMQNQGFNLVNTTGIWFPPRE